MAGHLDISTPGGYFEGLNPHFEHASHTIASINCRKWDSRSHSCIGSAENNSTQDHYRRWLVARLVSRQNLNL